MNQIIATTKFLKRSYFINYLKPSNGISNNHLYVETSTPICMPNQYTGLYTETILHNGINRYKQE